MQRSVASHSSLSKERWLLPLKLCVIVGIGFGSVAALTYQNALRAARQEATESILPLAIDAISSDLREEFTRPVLFASGMAANTFIADWQQTGERQIDPIVRYLHAIQKQYATTTAFFVSNQTLRYYHTHGVIKTISPTSAQDAWYYRLRSLDRPYEVNLDRDTAQLSRQTVFVNYKFLNNDGEFSGAIGVGHSTDVLSSLIKRSETRHDIRVLFLDPAGQSLSLDRDQHANLSGISSITGIGDHADRIRQSPESSFSYTSNGQEFFLRSKLLPELGWHLVVTTPVRLSDRVLYNTLLPISLTGLICLVLVLALVYRATSNHHGRLEQLACTDPLTRSLNRHSFYELMLQTRARCQRDGTPLAVALLDIDHFKQINDRLGHPAGDAVLQGFAEVLRQTKRGSDLLFRWGGEEFLLLVPGLTCEQTMAALQDVSPKLAEGGIATETERVPVTFSGGVTMAKPDDTTKTLLERADRALYRAKQEGRNRIVGI